MNNILLIASVVVLSVVFAYPGHHMDMEGGVMNMTAEHEWPMNMTGEHEGPMHHMNSSDGSKHWKKHGGSSEEQEKPAAGPADRKRRAVEETVQGVVDTASNTVHTAGQAVDGAAGDVEKTGEALANDANEGTSNSSEN